MDYRAFFATRKTQTPQSEPLENMVPNSAGGHAYAVDDWMRLARFLILGSEGGTYYIAARPLTRENAKAIERCITADGVRVVNEVVTISDQGRAPKNDPALFVLAMCAGLGDEATRKAAMAALPKVARTGTHLLHFAHFVEGFRGWGRSLRRAIANWYVQMDTERLTLQLVKYKQRDGWSHRDLLRLAHPSTQDQERSALFAWTVQPDNEDRIAVAAKSFRLIDGMQQIKNVTTASEAAAIIQQYSLPREVIPTQWLNASEVWDALLVDMPLTAMIRNLGKMSAIELLCFDSDASLYVAKTLCDKKALQKARIHPLNVLMAQTTYAAGRGVRGGLTWTAVPAITDALNDAFYLSFQNVKPTGKRIMLALDVSGSMGATINNSHITARQASAAMALVTVATEERVHTIGFTAGGDGITNLNISARQRLDDVVNMIDKLKFGSTDCALPMLYALVHKMKVDAFVIYTDSETWHGKVHPVEALRQYREATGINAKLIVVGMCSNGFSIADPNDAGMMDIVGFDSATPAVIADFIRGSGSGNVAEGDEDA